MNPDDVPQDPLPALIAGIDQAIAMVPQLARYARALFDGLVDEGFTEAQALHLTANQIKISD